MIEALGNCLRAWTSLLYERTFSSTNTMSKRADLSASSSAPRSGFGKLIARQVENDLLRQHGLGQKRFDHEVRASDAQRECGETYDHTGCNLAANADAIGQPE